MTIYSKDGIKMQNIKAETMKYISEDTLQGQTKLYPASKYMIIGQSLRDKKSSDADKPDCLFCCGNVDWKGRKQRLRM